VVTKSGEDGKRLLVAVVGGESRCMPQTESHESGAEAKGSSGTDRTSWSKREGRQRLCTDSYSLHYSLAFVSESRVLPSRPHLRLGGRVARPPIVFTLMLTVKSRHPQTSSNLLFGGTSDDSRGDEEEESAERIGRGSGSWLGPEGVGMRWVLGLV
jgi:hypothetical protein